MELSILENAFDYLFDAVKQLQGKRPSKRRIKYGIVHLWSGIELLIKKRLMDEHWSLIFKDINKADKAALNSGDFASVYFDDAIKRLKNICSVDIGPHKEILDKIRDDRNRLEHFQITLSKEAAISNVVKAWTFVLDFASSHLDFSKDPNSILLFEKIKKTIVIHEKFVNERLKFITPAIEANNSEKYPYTVIDCPECFQDSLFLKGGYSECLFCRTKEDWKKTMERWLIVHEGYRYFDLKERSIDPLIHECPECSHEGMFRFEDGDPQPPDPAAICFHCGVSIDFCEWCYYSDVCPNDKDGFCKECSIYLKRRDTEE